MDLISNISISQLYLKIWDYKTRHDARLVVAVSYAEGLSKAIPDSKLGCLHDF